MGFGSLQSLGLAYTLGGMQLVVALSALVAVVAAVASSVGLVLLVVRSSERSSAALMALVQRTTEQLAGSSADALRVLEESLRPVPPSPQELAAVQHAQAEATVLQHFDDSDPFDDLVAPMGRLDAAPLGGGDSPFGIPGLRPVRPEWAA